MEKILIFRGAVLAFWIGLGCWGWFYLNTLLLAVLPVVNMFTFLVFLNEKRKYRKKTKNGFLFWWVGADLASVTVGLYFGYDYLSSSDVIISALSSLFVVDIVLSILLTNAYSSQCRSASPEKKGQPTPSTDLWDSHNPGERMATISQVRDVNGSIVGISDATHSTWDSYNPANGLPMASPGYDMYGNMYGTSDTNSSSTSAFSDSDYNR
ncbi:hypothetical protein TB147_17870 [Klebsiella aerogenes]|uniref:hypothetical protein n=1 Tax=Klebsiella aerogenes TaxID=548 RepID=UPI002E347940|nr:hypothetical protein [Klebsiella aerogenes]MED7793173.1 hypothetical protein [Klebsiella aerogenes]